jgi:DNA-3-methyladenine glycosylase I
MKAGGSVFSRWLWSFVDGRPVQNSWRRMQQIPVSTPLSDALSKELNRCGFRFVGSTTVYAFILAAGMVNDHLVSCYRYPFIANANLNRRRS